MLSRIILICLAFFLLSAGHMDAAIYQSIRTDRFEWRVHSTEHFDIYYYESSAERLGQLAEILENSYQRIGKLYNYYPEEKTPFFIYSTHNQFEQTNIVPVGEGTGGVTEAFKNRFTVFNDGSSMWLNQVIPHEYTHVVQMNIFYGGFWKSARLIKSYFYPLWLLEGTSEFSTGELDSTVREMYIRDAATGGGLLHVYHLYNFNHLKPHQVTLAYKQSESIIRFIEQEYGREKIPKLFEIMKTRFDSSSFLQDLVGQDVFAFDKRYREYTEEKYSEAMLRLKEPSFYGKALTKNSDLPVFNTNPVFFPDGKRAAFISDIEGENYIYTMDTETGVREKIAGSNPEKYDRIYTEGRAVSITPDGKSVIFAGEYKQRSYIYKLDLRKRKLRKIKIKLDEVSSPSVSPDGLKLAFAGIKNTVSDIYVSDINGKNLMNITNDVHDDSYPVFAGNSNDIVYSSERYLREQQDHPYQRDLYLISAQSGSVTRLTGMSRNENMPSVSNDGRVYFVNDSDDILNIYSCGLDGRNIKKHTSIIGGNMQPAVSLDGKKLLFSSFRSGQMQLYISDTESLDLNSEVIESSVQAVAEGITDLGPKSPLGRKRDYRFKMSTDLIFPILFYSSLDGFFASIYYQASEYLGNHQFSAMLNYGSKEDIVDYDFAYTYMRFRPYITLGGGGENYYRDFDLKERVLEHAQYLAVEYPLSRVNTIALQETTIYRSERYKDERNYSAQNRENASSISLVRDTTNGRYLFLDSGSRIRASFEYSDDDFLESDYSYRNHVLEGVKLFPLFGRSVLAMRLLGGVSSGRDKGVFRLGGVDRVKGYARDSDSNKFNKVIVSNLRYEFPIIKDMNYYMWYFFPDLFFKGLYGAAFVDTGFGWTYRAELEDATSNDLKNSVGIGLHFYAFVLQTFQINLNFDWIKRTDSKSNIFYFTLGPTF